MAYKNLRDFLELLESRGDLKRITQEIDPYLDITEISDRTLNGTILLVMAGEITLEARQQKLTLKQGQAAFIEADTDYRVYGMQEGYAVLAGLPI